MKRSISERDHHQYENLTMANCLMFLSRNNNNIGCDGRFAYSAAAPASSPGTQRVFECKTCNRQFPSFQALGGHRASHKKPRLSAVDGSDSGGSPAKPKTHECTVCGLEFAIGQALGGHMRRHRTAAADPVSTATVGTHHYPLWIPSDLLSPVVKKISGNGGRRVLSLDLNLTPLENDIKILQLGKPLVNIF